MFLEEYGITGAVLPIILRGERVASEDFLFDIGYNIDYVQGNFLNNQLLQ